MLLPLSVCFHITPIAMPIDLGGKWGASMCTVDHVGRQFLRAVINTLRTNPWPEYRSGSHVQVCASKSDMMKCGACQLVHRAATHWSLRCLTIMSGLGSIKWIARTLHSINWTGKELTRFEEGNKHIEKYTWNIIHNKTLFRDMTPCSVVHMYRIFRETLSTPLYVPLNSR
jgi:hypothetical protein